VLIVAGVVQREAGVINLLAERVGPLGVEEPPRKPARLR
jgi:hypothetical protein